MTAGGTVELVSIVLNQAGLEVMHELNVAMDNKPVNTNTLKKAVALVLSVLILFLFSIKCEIKVFCVFQ